MREIIKLIDKWKDEKKELEKKLEDILRELKVCNKEDELLLNISLQLVNTSIINKSACILELDQTFREMCNRLGIK